MIHRRRSDMWIYKHANKRGAMSNTESIEHGQYHVRDGPLFTIPITSWDGKFGGSRLAFGRHIYVPYVSKAPHPFSRCFESNDQMILLGRTSPRIPANVHLLTKRLVLRRVSQFPKLQTIVHEEPSSVPVLQEIFRAPDAKSRHVLTYLGAITQVVFWGNLAQWAGTGYVTKDK